MYTNQSFVSQEYYSYNAILIGIIIYTEQYTYLSDVNSSKYSLLNLRNSIVEKQLTSCSYYLKGRVF